MEKTVVEMSNRGFGDFGGYVTFHYHDGTKLEMFATKENYAKLRKFHSLPSRDYVERVGGKFSD
jgi:hypothetical protein